MTTSRAPTSRIPTRLARLILAAALLAPAALLAQEDAPERSRECTCAFEFDAPIMRQAFRANRAWLGVTLGPARDVDGQRGIVLEDVLEGGPADRAGLLPGDVVLSLHGTPLGEEPAARLREVIGGVEPGDTVEVEYSREGRRQTARVVTDQTSPSVLLRSAAGPSAMLRAWPGNGGRTLIESRRLPGDGTFWYSRMTGDGLELAEMNPGLGSYFGTTEGVLVTSTPEDSSLGLRAGDVILGIGGRTVRDPAHVREILGSYRTDETISLDVFRDGSRTSISGTRR